MDSQNPMERRCTARSKQSGERCKRVPIPGGTVCRMHGGAAPQVQRSAWERLAALVDPAIDALQKALGSDDVNAAVRAARDVDAFRQKYGFRVRSSWFGARGLTSWWPCWRPCWRPSASPRASSCARSGAFEPPATF